MRGDSYGIRTIGQLAEFQFTPLREGRLTTVLTAITTYIFQFTPLREGRPSAASLMLSYSRFQFTPLREGRRTATSKGRRLFYFNSRPCVRGDQAAACLEIMDFISIHAPA